MGGASGGDGSGVLLQPTAMMNIGRGHQHNYRRGSAVPGPGRRRRPRRTGGDLREPSPAANATPPSDNCCHTPAASRRRPGPSPLRRHHHRSGPGAAELLELELPATRHAHRNRHRPGRRRCSPGRPGRRQFPVRHPRHRGSLPTDGRAGTHRHRQTATPSEYQSVLPTAPPGIEPVGYQRRHNAGRRDRKPNPHKFFSPTIRQTHGQGTTRHTPGSTRR